MGRHQQYALPSSDFHVGMSSLFFFNKHAIRST
jgi:hypothetical protein